MSRTETFEELRPLLFSIAYRMLGSAGDAEDVVQDAWLRWEQTTADVDSPKAWLTTTTTRLCIDHLRSARVRREAYVGPWLPEPLVTEEPEPTMSELADSLSLAFLVLLESLSPVERAVFLLREVFSYDYEEIARIVGKSEDNCRQLLHRAKARVDQRRARFKTSEQEGRRIAMEFLQACVTGDSARLFELLAPDVTLWSDGGDLVSAARRPVNGAGLVVRFLRGVTRKKPTGQIGARLAMVNGEPGFVLYEDGVPPDVGALEIVDGRIMGIRIVRNPEKLRRLLPHA